MTEGLNKQQSGNELFPEIDASEYSNVAYKPKDAKYQFDDLEFSYFSKREKEGQLERVTYDIISNGYDGGKLRLRLAYDVSLSRDPNKLGLVPTAKSMRFGIQITDPNLSSEPGSNEVIEGEVVDLTNDLSDDELYFAGMINLFERNRQLLESIDVNNIFQMVAIERDERIPYEITNNNPNRAFNLRNFISRNIDEAVLTYKKRVGDMGESEENMAVIRSKIGIICTEMLQTVFMQDWQPELPQQPEDNDEDDKPIRRGLGFSKQRQSSQFISGPRRNYDLEVIEALENNYDLKDYINNQFGYSLFKNKMLSLPDENGVKIIAEDYFAQKGVEMVDDKSLVEFDLNNIVLRFAFLDRAAPDGLETIFELDDWQNLIPEFLNSHIKYDNLFAGKPGITTLKSPVTAAFDNRFVIYSNAEVNLMIEQGFRLPGIIMDSDGSYVFDYRSFTNDFVKVLNSQNLE